MQRRRWCLALVVTLVLGTTSYTTASAGDWPMWRYDAGRTAASPHALPEVLHLQWVRDFPQLEPAWENPLNRDLMQFDKAYEPVVFGNTLFLGSSVADKLMALDAETGGEKWAFYAGGPVRFPPVASDGKVYFVSDDGYLYCVDAEKGSLVWKFRGGPSDRKILGNSRLVSTWCARGGPVLKDGVVYFGAGIWPFMGVYIHALDAETGEVIWTNDSSGSMYMKQPHNSPAYGGVAPQGTFVVSGDRLLVPCGRSAPACFDRRTGQFLYYRLGDVGKTGGAFVCAVGDRFVNYHRDMVTSLYDAATGDALIGRFGNIPVATEGALFCQGDRVTALDLEGMRTVEYDRRVKDKKTGEYQTVRSSKWVIDSLWVCGVDARGDLIKAGDRLYAGGEGVVTAIDLPTAGGSPAVSWQEKIEGTAARLIAADDRLFVVTLEGRIYAFGRERTGLPRISAFARSIAGTVKSTSGYLSHLWHRRDIARARAILETTGVREGYCLVYGLGDGRLAEALVRRSNLNVIGVDPDSARVDQLRRRLDRAGLLGERLTLHVGEPMTFEAPQYLASLILAGVPQRGLPEAGGRFIERIYRSLRPYGGVACLIADGIEADQVVDAIRSRKLPGGDVRRTEGLVLLTRQGALPGAADWTHLYGDIANTIKSDDELVKLPLGVLWFGGSSNMDVLPRHGHGPPELVVGGRLFIEGIDRLSARDVYTGRVLWKRELPGLGTFGVYFDETYRDTPLSTAYNQIHIPGANARGTNFVAASDGVYIVRGDHCLVLDPATGATLGKVELPGNPGEERPEWGYIGVYEDFLIAGEGLVPYTDFLLDVPEGKKRPFYNLDITTSKRLVVMDRHSGEVLWTRESELGFRHNAIAVGNGKIFCIDMMPPQAAEALRRRGRTVPGTPRLLALDVATGESLWGADDQIFGTWLGYSEDNDVLIQAGRPSRDMVVEPRRGLVAYRGENGRELWRRDVSYGGPCILHGETIITDRYAYDLLTGIQKRRIDPLTGEDRPWGYSRRYGCNSAIASEHLLTFRSAAAGYYDLTHDGGTGNFGGFRSGCTSNLVAANGVLNAPDYTRTCSCSYQNQTSLALVHDPDVELWVTYFGERGDGPLRDVAINLGAPGNRRAEDGRFWVGHPVLPHVKDPEKESGIGVGADVTFTDGGFYTHHSSRITDDGDLGWVTASGCRGISRLELDLATDKPARCRVQLYFAEPDRVAPGHRVFDVSIEGERALAGIDVVAEAGGQNRSTTRTVEDIEVADGKLTLEFSPTRAGVAGPDVLPLLCGLEVSVMP